MEKRRFCFLGGGIYNNNNNNNNNDDDDNDDDDNNNNNHNYNKILKSDWFSTALISALIGQYASCLSN